MEWDGKSEFNAAEEHEWEGIGLARTAKGLTFLQVYDAGHMVRTWKSNLLGDNFMYTFLTDLRFSTGACG